jgi:peptide subunit release factor 1 (eRF1)
MSKQAMRDEAERLIREAMEKKSISIKRGDTRIETKCGKCGAVNKVSAAPGETQVKYKCKECGLQQNAL